MSEEIREERSDIPWGAHVVEYEPGLFIVGGRYFYYRDGWVIDPKNNNRNHIATMYGADYEIKEAVWDMFELRECRDCVNCVSCSFCENCTDCSDCCPALFSCAVF